MKVICEVLLVNIIIISVACKEPNNWESRCADQVEYSCTDLKTNGFFSGLINDNKLCIASGVDNYTHFAGTYNSFSTTPDNPAYDPSNPPLIEGKGLLFNLVKVESGVNALHSWSISLIGPELLADSFNLISELDGLESITSSLGNEDITELGYEFSISFCCPTDGKVGLGDPYLQSKNVSFVHDRVTQPVDAYIKVSSFHKEDFDSYWKYDITFEMQFRLYYMDEVWKEFGDLEQGIFKTTTIVSK